MSSIKRSNNLAARMGRWSASHWKTAVFGWLGFVIVSLALGMAVGQKTLDQNDTNVGQAHRADHMLRDAGFQLDPQTEFVLIQSPTLTAGERAFRAAIADVVKSVLPFAGIKNLRAPLDGRHPDLVSRNRHTALVEWEMKGDADTAKKHIDPVTAATAKVADRHPGLYVGEAGSVSSGKALDAMFSKQLKQAGERSVPLTLLVLVVAFGALAAAGVPLLLALTAVFATVGLVALPSHLVPMDQSVSAVLLLIGLAVGVDYSLFYLKREREERAAGKGQRAALEAAAATSGRSVLVSGVTVMIAMAGMLFSGDKTYLSFGIATMMVVAIAMIGSLTVLPALLAKLGNRVEKGRIPFLSRRLRSSNESRLWSAVLTPALRHPLVSALAAGGILVAMALPTLHMHTNSTGLDSLPKSAPTVETIHKLQTEFVGAVQPASVAIRANIDHPAVQRAIAELKARALASDRMHGPIDETVNTSRTTARVDIPLAGKGSDEASNTALRELRGEILPATIGAVPDVEWAVTGYTAATADATSLLKRSAPIVFAFVLTFAFLLLLVSFRSIVVAAKAIVLNLLSVGAAYGALVATFQWGWGAGLLGFQSSGGIAYWLPIFMFVILFGLSMDYHVLILSRVREAYDAGMSTERAVSQGIQATAGVVTSAAIVMVAVFAIFATLGLVDMKMMGVGLAVAVFLDATVVRAILLPAAMKLLGDWNWYLPGWLEWLPRVTREPAVAARAPRTPVGA